MNVFLPETFCVVVLVAENGEFQRFEGVYRRAFTCAYSRVSTINIQRKTLQIYKIRRFQLQERQHTTV